MQATTKSGAASSGGGKAVDVCSLMPADTVAHITGEPVTEAKPDDEKVLTDNGIYTCKYTSADGTSGLNLTEHMTNGKIGYDAGQGAHHRTPLETVMIRRIRPPSREAA